MVMVQKLCPSCISHCFTFSSIFFPVIWHIYFTINSNTIVICHQYQRLKTTIPIFSIHSGWQDMNVPIIKMHLETGLI